MTSIAEFRQHMNARIKPDDIVKAILAETTDKKIIKEPAIIHKAFYALVKKTAWKEYLKCFYFNESGISPFSYELDQVLSRLETARILSTPNPSYDSYDLKKEFLEPAVRKFDSRGQEDIRLMAIEFEANLH